MSRIALCLAGGGITGAMYQIGALAALEASLTGLDPSAFDLYVGTASGAQVAAALAGGVPINRLYRALLDPADPYFPLQRSHLLRIDLAEWRATLSRAFDTFRHGTASLFSRTPAPSPDDLWEQLDRFHDSLPAGLFSLDEYERFLEQFFTRRGIPTRFPAMPRALRIPAYDLDAATRVVFGAPGHDDVPVARACAASMAKPLFYSPVQIGERHYVDGSVGAVAHIDVALESRPDVVLVINPLVPITAPHGDVPTGHGRQASLRDKGLMWIYSQALRIAAQGKLDDRLALLDPTLRERVLVFSPDAGDSPLFLYNPASFSHRRTILEHAFHTTRDRITQLAAAHPTLFEQLRWSPKRPS